MLFRKTLIAALLIASLPIGVLPAASRNGEELLNDRGGHTVVPEVRRPTRELISSLKLPEGFKIGIFAEELGAPRMICVGDDGTVYVTRREAGDVIALRDTDGNGRAGSRKTVVGNLPGVHGITIHGGRMYLCTARELYVADLKGSDVGPPRKVLGGLPPGGRHPNRTIAFGPEGGSILPSAAPATAVSRKARRALQLSASARTDPGARSLRRACEIRSASGGIRYPG